MQVNSEDITVAWGQAPHPLDSQYGKWRLAVFQDLQESNDGSKLYFLYDPEADEKSVTTGSRKGYPGLIIFDVNFRCFAGEISVHAQGTMKFLFSLKCPSPQGGSAFVLVTEEQMYGQTRLHFFRLDLSQDGTSIANCRSLLPSHLTIGGEYIVAMREDVPEVVVMSNPGLQVWRVNAMADAPEQPISNFIVHGADLSHFQDGFLSNGNVYLISASPDGHLDSSRVYVLSLDNPGQINTHACTPDPQRGMPSPRRQGALIGVPNAILLAGGEFEHNEDNVQRLLDYWMLDVRTFQWTQLPATMPCPLIEPRLSVSNSNNIYLWGDYDVPLPGMPPQGTHVRILRCNGLDRASYPPSYNQAINHPPAYPAANQPPYPGGGQGPYPNAGSAPPYPSYNPNQGGYSQQGGYGAQSGYPAPNAYPPQNKGYPGDAGCPQPNYGQGFPGDANVSQPYGQGGYSAGPGQTAYYPPKKDKKDCTIQ